MSRPATRRRAARPAARARARAAAFSGNAVVGQSGGPTAVINQSLAGVILEARRHAAIGRLFGTRHGVQGLLKDDLVDLTRTRAALLEQVAATPAAALGSVRKK